MLSGSGIDILRTERFRKLRNKSEFVKNVFTPQEVAQASAFFQRDHVYSALFTLKEAILKAIGIGLSHGSPWQQIELDRKLLPTITQALFDPTKKVHASVACTKDYTLSVALAERRE